MQSPPPNDNLQTSNRDILIRLHSSLTRPAAGKFDRRTAFWLCLSVAVSLAFAYQPLRQAFSSHYVLQDDSRQHIFWLERFLDHALFRHDLIADYYQAVAPYGYTAFYRVMAAVGVDPLLLGKLLPVVLGLATTVVCFAVSLRLFPVPSAAFLSSLLLNQAVWASDNIISSTPRAFMYPLLLLFLSSLLRCRTVTCLLSIVLTCLFYPPIVLLPIAILLLNILRREDRRIHFSRDHRDYLLCAAALAFASLILLPYALGVSAFGPVVSAAEARAMPEFLPGGRMVVFRESFFEYWISGNHTGMFSSSPLKPIGFTLALLLPLAMHYTNRFPLARRISGIGLFPRILFASVALFFAAHALLFKLYLPSRFTAHAFRIVLALSAGISAIVVLDGVFTWARRVNVQSNRTALSGASIAALSIAALILYPCLDGSLTSEKYRRGQAPELYQYLASQPRDSLVASLSREADNLPVFSKRSILIGRETALPFHKAYYGRIRQRAVDLINAQYSPDITEVQHLIREYGVTFILLDRRAFTPDYLSSDKWVMQFRPAAREAVEKLRRGDLPALAAIIDRCQVLESRDLVLLDANRVLAESAPDNTGKVATSSNAAR